MYRPSQLLHRTVVRLGMMGIESSLSAIPATFLPFADTRSSNEGHSDISYAFSPKITGCEDFECGALRCLISRV